MKNYFHFKQLNEDTFLITNDFGKYQFLPREAFARFASGQIKMGDPLYDMLHQNLFLLEPADLYAPDTSFLLRDMKQYVFGATSLHIFVVTNNCNLQCVYCQAQAHQHHQASHGFMTPETARKAVDIALQSPANSLTFEFQGGEPLLNFPAIREIVTYAEKQRGQKQISYTLVSNLSLLTEEMLDFFILHHVSISTSLDGPQKLHDQNRPHSGGKSSHELMQSGASRIHTRGYSLGGIETTTRKSLGMAKEIVQAYLELGCYGIFLRPLTPLGFAANAWEDIGYTPDEFLAFYREAFNEILRINQTGVLFPELHAAIFLRKNICSSGGNYMDLRSPCGAGIGQLAYYYDGSIYTCDEARMVAESGDPAFLLGNVDTHSYRDLIRSPGCQAVCTASVTESLPGCCDCVYQPYCGTCPVVNYASHGDIFPKGTADYRCRIYSGMLDYLFSLLRENDPEIMGILKSWVEG